MPDPTSPDQPMIPNATQPLIPASGQTATTVSGQTAIPNDNNKASKLLFLAIFLFIVIVVLAIVVFYLLSRQKSTAVQCEYNGVKYNAGQGFSATDGCNSCSCGEDGQIACTLIACLNGTPGTEPSEEPAASESANKVPLTKTWTNSLAYPNNHVLNTDNWQSFSLIEEVDELTQFSIKYPESWISFQNTSQTFDFNDKKIAEIVGVVYLNPSQTCFDTLPKIDYQTDFEGSNIDFVSEEDVSGIGNLSGVRRIENVPGDNSPTMTVLSYCLYVQINPVPLAFLMNFYEKVPGEGDRQLFEAVLESFKLL